MNLDPASVGVDKGPMRSEWMTWPGFDALVTDAFGNFLRCCLLVKQCSQTREVDYMCGKPITLL